MLFYRVAKLGTGVGGDSYRADVPDGTSWVGSDLKDGTFLIGTNSTLPNVTPLTDSALQQGCALWGVSYADVMGKWKA